MPANPPEIPPPAPRRDWLAPDPHRPERGRVTALIVGAALVGMIVLAVAGVMLPDDIGASRPAPASTAGPTPVRAHAGPVATPWTVFTENELDDLQVVGPRAADVLVTAFGVRSAGGFFTAQIQLANLSDQGFGPLILKVTARDGDTVVATASGRIEGIAPVTAELAEVSGDDGRFVKRDRYRYTVEVS